MFELFILWRVGQIRDQLADAEAESIAGALGFAVALQVVLWPASLFGVVGKKFGWVAAFIVTSSLVALSLIFDWGYYFIIGFLAALALACVFAYHLTFSD